MVKLLWIKLALQLLGHFSVLMILEEYDKLHDKFYIDRAPPTTQFFFIDFIGILVSIKYT